MRQSCQHLKSVYTTEHMLFNNSSKDHIGYNLCTTRIHMEYDVNPFFLYALYTTWCIIKILNASADKKQQINLIFPVIHDPVTNILSLLKITLLLLIFLLLYYSLKNFCKIKIYLKKY